MNFELIYNNIPELLKGTWTTIWIVSSSLSVGLVIAIITAVGISSKNKLFSIPAHIYSYVFRGTPLLIQLYIFCYGIPNLGWVKESFLWDFIFESKLNCALLVFILNTGAYTSEIIKGSMRNTPVGEIEASKSMGMSDLQTLYRIILPSAFRRAIPAYGNEIVYMLHGSAVLYILSIMDVMGVAKNIIGSSYNMYVYVIAALIYLFLTILIVLFMKLLEKKFLVHLKQAQHKKV